MFRIWGLGFRVLILSHDRIFSGLGFRVKRYKLSLGNEFWCSSSAIYSRVLQGFSEGCRASSGIEFWCFGIYRVLLRWGKGASSSAEQYKALRCFGLDGFLFWDFEVSGFTAQYKAVNYGNRVFAGGGGWGSYISGL